LARSACSACTWSRRSRASLMLSSGDSALAPAPVATAPSAVSRASTATMGRRTEVPGWHTAVHECPSPLRRNGFNRYTVHRGLPARPGLAQSGHSVRVIGSDPQASTVTATAQAARATEPPGPGLAPSTVCSAPHRGCDAWPDAHDPHMRFSDRLWAVGGTRREVPASFRSNRALTHAEPLSTAREWPMRDTIIRTVLLHRSGVAVIAIVLLIAAWVVLLKLS